MEAPGTAVDLTTLAWIKTVTIHAAPVKMEATPRRTITTSFEVVMGYKFVRADRACDPKERQPLRKDW
jgi:hypothetical protein